MAVINTGLVERGLRSEFFQRFAGTTTYWQDLCTRVQSNTAEEKYRFLGSLPQLREMVDGRRPQGLLAESYDGKNLKYEATIEVDRDEIDDDQTGQIRMRVNELAEAAATHKDFLVEALLNHGEDVDALGYDGLPFFSDSHVSGDSGTQSNKLTSEAAAADAMPTVAEFRAALSGAIAAMVAFKDDRGNPIRIPPNPAGFRVVVPPAMMFTAFEALGLPLAPSDSNPVANNILRNAGTVITYPGITGTRFFLLKTDAAVRPFIFQDRSPVEFRAVAEGSAEEFKREKYLYGVRARYAFLYARWYYAIQHTFTT